MCQKSDDKKILIDIMSEEYPGSVLVTGRKIDFTLFWRKVFTRFKVQTSYPGDDDKLWDYILFKDGLGGFELLRKAQERFPILTCGI